MHRKYSIHGTPILQTSLCHLRENPVCSLQFVCDCGLWYNKDYFIDKGILFLFRYIIGVLILCPWPVQKLKESNHPKKFFYRAIIISQAGSKKNICYICFVHISAFPTVQWLTLENPTKLVLVSEKLYWLWITRSSPRVLRIRSH